MEISALQKARYAYQPKLPSGLAGELTRIEVRPGGPTEAAADKAELKALFTHTYGKPIVRFTPGAEVNSSLTRQLAVGVILSGGQAPGGHNVIAGLFDGLKKGNPGSRLYGFLGGPSGLIENKTLLITSELMDQYRNTGGFDLIMSGRTKIETPDQFAASLKTAKALGLNAVVIIGGDDSNTNAALLAEYFIENNASVQVIGCPKTIDGDLKHEYIEASFGFDTACKTYSEVIGNIARDALSAQKYWYFIKLMGRSASHIALECALQTHPNVCLISEEVEAEKLSLAQVVEQICDSIVKRAANGDNFGVVLIPEGLIEFIPEIKALITELNDAMAEGEAEFAALHSFDERKAWLEKTLKAESFAAFNSLPREIAAQLLLDRDPHGNVQVSLIATEHLLSVLAGRRLAELRKTGAYKGAFSVQHHFFGYEGRCAFPSNFDADYCYALGMSAFVLIAAGLTGYLASVRNLTSPASEWIAGGIPLTMMMNMEQRHGSKKPVIKKALVKLDGAPFKAFAAERDTWAVKSSFLFPGAIQYYGPSEICDQPTMTLKLEQAGK
jgi:pyrophosphate--fructose-6-phosphate 1-phosphotransferase